MTSSGKRRHERSAKISIIEYVVEPFDYLSFDGVTANVSESGFCLLTRCPLSKGDKITLKKKMHSSSVTAVVRWSDKSSEYYCKAGLEFE